MAFRSLFAIATSTLLALGSALATQDSAMPEGHMQHMQMAAPPPTGAEAPAIEDTRQPVRFPEKIRAHELWSMRDHLKTLQKMQQYLADGQYDELAQIAEQRLGMSSFGLHGAHESAPYMPKGMQQAGGAMHQSASRLARVATDAAVTEDSNEVLRALADLTSRCIACHDAYRLE